MKILFYKSFKNDGLIWISIKFLTTIKLQFNFQTYSILDGHKIALSRYPMRPVIFNHIISTILYDIIKICLKHINKNSRNIYVGYSQSGQVSTKQFSSVIKSNIDFEKCKKLGALLKIKIDIKKWNYKSQDF